MAMRTIDECMGVGDQCVIWIEDDGTARVETGADSMWESESVTLSDLASLRDWLTERLALHGHDTAPA